MKHIVPVLFFFYCFGGVYAQQRDCSLQKDSLTKEMILFLPDHAAEPVGGLPALGKEISRNFRIPEDNATAYTDIYIAFIVDHNGKIKGERTLRQTEPDAAAQAFKAIENLTWKPATCNGRNVSSIFVLPLHLQPER